MAGTSPGDVTCTPHSDTYDPRPTTAEEVLRSLLPSCSSAVYGRLRREQIRWAQELASLERDDLRELGLSMVERSRVLRWARELNATKGVESIGSITSGLALEPCLEHAVLPPPAVPPQASFRRMYSTDLEGDALSAYSEELTRAAFGKRGVSPSSDSLTEDVEEHLDKVEEQIPFWCQIVAQQPVASQPPLHLLGDKLRGKGALKDIRETVLEDRFDLTPERIREIYNTIPRDDDGRIDLEHISGVLVRYGLPGLDSQTVSSILKAVNPGSEGPLKLAEFESIVSRLKLAQLLVGTLTDHKAAVAADQSVADEHLSVIDYSMKGPRPLERVKGHNLLKFFFGHRPRPKALNEAHTIRWVHMGHFNPTLLLALMVKYGLHPLGVEDVIDQCPTKIDRYEGNYFMAVELLCLAQPRHTTAVRGSEKVSVVGRHVTAFCAGPPQSDTLVTVVQADRSFTDDWPSPQSEENSPTIYCDVGDDWVTKLRERISASRSRVCERRADFLVYQILDLCTDELVAVTRAFGARLMFLERELHKEFRSIDTVSDGDWLFDEVSVSRLQLTVVMRRLRGIRRVLRRMLEDPDLSAELHSYLQDVVDHVEEAQEDLSQLSEKCTVLTDAFEHAIERQHALERQRAEEVERLQQRIHEVQAERLNKILFSLTVATTIFVPLQFITGIYGMNFVDPVTGKPSIPELNVKKGYEYFWLFCLLYLISAGSCAYLLFRRMMRRDQEETAGLRSNMQSLKSPSMESLPDHHEVRAHSLWSVSSGRSRRGDWNGRGRSPERPVRSRSLAEPLL